MLNLIEDTFQVTCQHIDTQKARQPLPLSSKYHAPFFFHEEPPSVTILSPSLLLQPFPLDLWLRASPLSVALLVFYWVRFTPACSPAQTNKQTPCALLCLECFHSEFLQTFQRFIVQHLFEAAALIHFSLPLTLSARLHREADLMRYLCLQDYTAPRPRRAAVASLACSLPSSVKFVYFMPH